MTIAIAAAALAVSLTTLGMTRWRDRRDLFLRIHERLASIELQEGRRLIHELLRDKGLAVADLATDQRAQINHTLSSTSVASFYYTRRYIRRPDMIAQWGQLLADVCDSTEPFFAYRDAEVGGRIWPELRTFAVDARRQGPRGGCAVPVLERLGKRPLGSEPPCQP